MQQGAAARNLEDPGKTAVLCAIGLDPGRVRPGAPDLYETVCLCRWVLQRRVPLGFFNNCGICLT
jgi:hypothetical protein